MQVVEKVTAFVTREGANGRELLIFRHPLNGLQLPAGTVEKGELPETAVLREAAEETGLEGLVLKRPLGRLHRVLPDNHFLVLGTTRLLAAPNATAPPASGFIFYRGSYVRLLREQHGFAEVLMEEWDERAEPPSLLRREQGWLPRDWLTSHIHRYQYWLQCEVETAESWTVFVDGHHFELFWTPLRPPPSLVWPQDEWLTAVYDVFMIWKCW
jgi:8-oxo-dGTP pyrophosphatase MutT (NUDIX family)